MLQLKICGRAGNQLFQYATVYSYMKEKNIQEKLFISFEELKKRKTDNKSFFDVLKFFNVEEYVTIDKIYMTKIQKILDFFYRAHLKIIRTFRKIIKSNMKYYDYKFIEKIWHKLLNKNGLYYFMPTNRKFYKSNSNNIIFYGSFESEKYFEKYKKDIFSIYSPKNGKIEKNREMYNIIEHTNSVCVTIRRGDFLIDKFKKDFYICTPEYFEKAIEKMDTILEKPQYIIFSDDIEWCKKNIKFPNHTLYENGNDPIWEKIRLMYSCKNFIISNSTFSWWAQYLSKNNNKLVIAPKTWNRFEYSKEIYEDNWIIIE